MDRGDGDSLSVAREALGYLEHEGVNAVNEVVDNGGGGKVGAMNGALHHAKDSDVDVIAVLS